MGTVPQCPSVLDSFEQTFWKSLSLGLAQIYYIVGIMAYNFAMLLKGKSFNFPKCGIFCATHLVRAMDRFIGYICNNFDK